MKFVSYNIQYSKGKDGEFELERIVDELKGADVIALGSRGVPGRLLLGVRFDRRPRRQRARRQRQDCEQAPPVRQHVAVEIQDPVVTAPPLAEGSHL